MGELLSHILPEHADSWLTARDRPLDLGGPTRPFRRLATDFIERPAFATFRDVARRLPEKAAVMDGNQQLTYRELLDASSSLASRIRAATPEGAAVGILMPSSASFAVTILGCLAAGRPYVALDSRYPVQRNKEIIGQAGLSVLIVDSAQPGADLDLPHELQLLDLAYILAGAKVFGADVPVPSVAADAPASILYTSGSTGRPKGIVNSQRNLLQRVFQHVDASHIDSDDVFLLLSSFCTIAGTREALTALLTGARLVVADPKKVGLRAIRTVVRDQGISVLYALPALISAVIGVETTGRDFCSLRLVRLGGDRVLWSDIALVRRALPAACHIQIGYSSTETTGTQWFVPPHFPENSPSAPVGYILPGISFAVLDEDASPVPPGEVGELVVRSRYVALGHWDNGRCVPDAMRQDLNNPQLRIFPTGDLVRKAEDGLIEVIGRKDRQIKINGNRVEPAELEVLLRRSSKVSDAAVIARRSEEQTSLVAFVVPVPGSGPRLRDELGAAIRAVLPPPLHPARLHLLEAIPRLPSAKLDMQALQDADETAKERDCRLESPYTRPLVEN